MHDINSGLDMALRNQIIIWSTDICWWVWICEMVCHGFGWCFCWVL